jgi:hypothetical protein
MPRDLGDFQTPMPLVMEILACLNRQGKRWQRVLEPTCGRGNFIKGILDLGMVLDEIQGIEVQENYVAQARRFALESTTCKLYIHHANIFGFHLQHALRWQTAGPLLVVGNPPWVTNTELSTLKSTNVPRKSNIKGLAGLEAMTGGGNFDITEYIWLKLIHELANEHPTIALLCKTSVARNILQYAAKMHLPVSNATLWKIDAKQWFKAAVDACLFSIELCQSEPRYMASVYTDLRSDIVESTISIKRGQFVIVTPEKPTVLPLEGQSPIIWRQGIKHDAAPVVELTYGIDSILYNKLGEPVIVEDNYIYPLLKSSDLGGKPTKKARPLRAIIVPQKRVGDDTIYLKDQAPDLWRYLTIHQHTFEQRKSIVYRNHPMFAYFGIGDYSFAPYKVAISGMYKSPVFRAIGPISGKPVMFDDTCYFLPCSSAYQAALIVSLLNHPQCSDFIHSIVFWDAKRPITKKLLQRIDLLAALRLVDRNTLMEQVQREIERLAPNAEVAWPESLEDLLVTGELHAQSTVQLALFG